MLWVHLTKQLGTTCLDHLTARVSRPVALHCRNVIIFPDVSDGNDVFTAERKDEQNLENNTRVDTLTEVIVSAEATISARPALMMCSSRSFSMGSIPLGTLSMRENIR